jgi:1-aminocyclopropane-1-carboxylate deaminase/D-cysteine desulfhydrase-like pyridoxal-dependent ACC family enzyme
VVGLRTAGLATVVHGIAVTPPAELLPAVASLVAELGAVDGLAAAGNVDVLIDGDQLGAGYGIPTTAADEATRLLARSEGILVDPIYTAKALAGLIARVRDGAFDGRRVVFWHAGGAPGLFEPLDGSVAG